MSDDLVVGRVVLPASVESENFTREECTVAVESISTDASGKCTPVVPLEDRVIALEKRVAILTDWLRKLTRISAEVHPVAYDVAKNKMSRN